MCKAFPYESGTWSVKCTVIGSQMREGEYREVDAPIELWEASDKFNRHIKNRRFNCSCGDDNYRLSRKWRKR